MAKKDSGSKDGATATATGQGDGQVPVFSADALSKLTERIQKDFDKVGDNGNLGKGGKKRKPDKKLKGREGTRAGTSDKKPDGRNFTPRTSFQSTHIVQSTGGKNSGSNSGKSAGKGVGKKAPEEQKSNSKPVQLAHRNSTPKNRDTSEKAKATFPKKPGSNSIDKDALLKEILELGGTQADMDLVAGLESDDEEEEVVISAAPKAKNVKKGELEAFMKEIGLKSAKLSDVSDVGVEEEEQDWEDDDDGGSGSGSSGESPAEASDEEDKESDIVMEGKLEQSAPEKDRKGGLKLLFVKRPDWHAELLPPLDPPTNPPSPETVRKLHERAKKLLTAENELYSKTHLAKSSDRQFLSQIMQSGTLSDKISALTLVCQESPLHATKTLENLLALARKKSRSQKVMTLGAIKDLFGPGVILPPNRKLKTFAKQPCLGARGTQDMHLLVWAYEDWLKKFYFEVLKTLDALSTDQLVYPRNNAVSYIFELLKQKPEQEENLLRMLVNKLGDADKKVASKVSYLLLQMQNAHPAMKSVIVNSVESEVVFRPGNSIHAKYYAIITLNQTILGTREHDVANKLLNLYFSLFTSLLQKKETSAGASASAQSAKGNHTKFNDSKPEKMNKKAKARAEKKEKQNQFEEEANAKLISAVLTGVNRAFPFSKVDEDVFDQHMDTLFRITHTGNFNTSIQALMLIFQVSNSKQAVSDRFYRTLYESLLDPRLVHSSKQTMYLNLLFKALKTDTSLKRIKAFVKRILQSATFHQPAFICGIIYLLSELETIVPGIRSLITDPEPNEDGDEEVFRDVPDEDDAPAEETPVAPREQQHRTEYDGRKRDPLHAEADRSCLWELLSFTNHFHPTVSIFAQHYLEKKKMPSKPDLGMHSLSSFLDRFVYRNPKAQPPTTKGTSIMQPLAGGYSMGMVLSTKTGKKATVPVNSEQFWKKRVEDVRPEEVFFHKYFNLTQPGEKKERKEKKKRDSEEGGDESGQEEEIWNALVGSRPELEGDDGDVDFDDDDDIDIEMSGDNEGGIDLEDDEDVWDTEDGGDDDDNDDDDEDGDEGAQVGGAAAFETALSRATAKRQWAADVVDVGSDSEEAEVAQKNQKKRRKLKNLPTFASMEDYMHMMSDSE